MSELERLALGCLLPGFEGLVAPPWLLHRLEEGLGGAVLFARNVESPAQVASLTASLKQVRPDLVIAIDEEGGDVTRLEAGEGSSYPGNAALGQIDDPVLTHDVAAAIGHDLHEVGITLDFAPVADLVVNPDNPVIGVRSFGPDAARVSAHVGAFVRGLQHAGVAACAKHFPGHGNTEVDSHVGLPTAPNDPQATQAGLRPFRSAIDAGVKAIMTAHLIVPALDDRPATLSRTILTGLLRGQLGFEGTVITDGMDMGAIALTSGFEEGSVQALAAGADAICMGGDPTSVEAVDRLTHAIVAAVRDGHLPESRLRDAARRVRQITMSTPAADRPARGAIGLEAARQALLARGKVRLGARPVIVELRSERAQAVSARPTTPGMTIAAGDPSATHYPVSRDGADVAPVMTAAAGRPLAVVVQDLHRDPLARQLVESTLARRPDAVVVELGLPIDRPAGAAGYLAAFGAGRVNVLAVRERLLSPGTERAHPIGAQIRSGDTLTLLRLMHTEERAGVDAIEPVIEAVALAVEAIAGRLRAGGSLHYFGAGSSGRLAALDALECPGTFGIADDVVVAHVAPDEASEDDDALGQRDAGELSSKDVAVAVSAGGSTRYAGGALQRAHQNGAFTVAITCAPGSPLGALADRTIEVATGPELVAGSTRLKAGTVQKIILSMLSTGVFTRLGHVYRGRMVDVRASNEKLRRRAAGIVADLTGADADRVGRALDSSGGNPKLAILMLRTGLSRSDAEARLRAVAGDLALALGEA